MANLFRWPLFADLNSFPAKTRKSQQIIYYFLIPILLLIVSATYAQPQQAKRSHWFLAGSAGYTQIAEENINRLVNKGLSVSGTVSREFGSDEMPQELKARIGVALAKTSYEGQYRSVIPDLLLQYTLLKTSETGGMSWHLGGFARMQLQDSYYAKLDQGRYYWANFTGIGFHADLSRMVNDNSEINIGIELPVAGFVSRPERERYFRIDEFNLGNLFKRNFSNLQAASVNRFLNPTLTVALVRQGLINRIGYEGNFMSVTHSGSNDFKRIDHRLFIRVKL